MKDKLYHFKIVLRYAFFVAFGFCFFHLFSYLPQNEVSEQENRTLAQRPNFGYASPWNHQFGKHTENWLKDQFPYREEIIKAQFKAMHKINGRTENEKAFMLDNGWFFSKWKTIRFLSGEKKAETLKIFKETFDKISLLAASKNVSLIFVLLPERESFYKDLWSKYYKPYDVEPFYQSVLNILQSYPNIDVLYPYDAFKKMDAETPVFLKNDGHLSSEGANLLLNEVYQKIQQKYFPDENIKYKTTSDWYKSGNVSVQLGFEREKVKSFRLKNVEIDINKQKISQSQKNMWLKQTEILNPIIDKNLYLYGICYSKDTLYPLLKYFFKKTQTFTVYGSMPQEEKLEVLEDLKKVWQNLENDSIVIFIMLNSIVGSTLNVLNKSLKGI